MIARAYDALLLDLDGTLVGATDDIEPELAARLRELVERGIAVRIVTGRSEGAVDRVLDQIGRPSPVVVYNGAGIWDPDARVLLEERVLSNRVVDHVLELCDAHGLYPVVQSRGAKACPPPPTPAMEASMVGMSELGRVAREDLPREYLMRIAIYSETHASSGALRALIEDSLTEPVYLTDFPLGMLACHRQSRVVVVDVHPPCLGKGEALRVLEERDGIPRERVVAVGDASNDVPMLEMAGLGVAVQGSMEAAVQAADRVLEVPGPRGIAALIDELFG